MPRHWLEGPLATRGTSAYSAECFVPPKISLRVEAQNNRLRVAPRTDTSVMVHRRTNTQHWSRILASFCGMNGNEVGVFDLKMPNFDPQQKWRRLFVNQWWE